MDVHRLAKAIAGFFAAAWGVALLAFATFAGNGLMTAIATATGGLILLGVSYALYRSLAPSQAAPRD